MKDHPDEKPPIFSIKSTFSDTFSLISPCDPTAKSHFSFQTLFAWLFLGVLKEGFHSSMTYLCFNV